MIWEIFGTMSIPKNNNNNVNNMFRYLLFSLNDEMCIQMFRVNGETLIYQLRKNNNDTIEKALNVNL